MDLGIFDEVLTDDLYLRIKIFRYDKIGALSRLFALPKWKGFK